MLMEHTQSRENREGNSSSRDSYRYDNDQSQKGRWHDGGGGQRHDRDVVWQPSINGGGRGYGRGRGRFNRPYSGNVRDGFDHPSYPNTGIRNQEYVEGNDNSNRSRPHDKHSEDHMRDSSPDRNDRARPTDKQYEDHARDQSPDRSSNEQYQYIQGAECGTNNKSMNWNQSQSQHYQGNCGKSDQGYQQGYDNQFDGKQDYYNYTGSQGQGGYGAYGNQQSSNLNYRHNKNWNQQEQHGYWDGNKQKEFPKDRRPSNRFSEDHIRDPIPDRNDRVRHKDKQNEDHAREPSPDRSSNEQCTQRAECVRNNDSVKWKQGQSKHYQGKSGKSEQVYQQGYDYQYDGKQDYYSSSQGPGRYGAYGNQQSSNWNYNHNKYWNQQDGNKQEEFPKDRRPRNRVENQDLKPLLSHVEATLVIHGTYFNSWEKIKLTGLSRMGRNHIHFAAGKPGENGVISEIRSSCEVMIYINLQKALEGGLKFFWSANNVILSPGNEDGVIPPAYFEAVVLRNPRRRLEFDQNVTITRVPVGGESLAQGKSKKKKKKKGKGGDEEEGEGTEKKSKKEKNEIDDSAIEDTGSLFNEEKIEVQGKDVQRVVEKIEGQEENVQRVVEKKEEKIEVQEENVEQMEVTEQKAPEKWDEDEDYEDAVQDDDCHDTEDGSDVIDEPRRRLEFDQNVTITRVPVGGESLAQGKSKKKKKKKGKGGDEEEGEGTEKKSKKEKNEIDDSAIEDTGSLFNEEKIEVQEEDLQRVVEKKEEKIEGQEENVQRVVEKMEEKIEGQEENVQRVVEKKEEKIEGQEENVQSVVEQKEEKIEEEEENVEKMEVTEQKAPEKWDEDEDYEDAVQDHDDDFHDAEDGSAVIEEPIVIEDAPASVSAVEYLKGQEVVAVYCDQSEDTFSKIVCAVSDKFYIFDIEKTPDIMSEGKLAEFFNSKEKPEKVFHGLTSRICATFFEKFEIILNGTKIFDLKMAYDIMNTQGLGNMTELKQTRYDPGSVPTSLESCNVMAYLKGFQYLDKVMKNETNDYKKQLFEMVNAGICKDKMKKLRDQRKTELPKSLNLAHAPSKYKSKKK